ncbi:MAG: hypothetical protein P1U46_02685 [Patescibacteria group bacterium]|nr:hypothetical protein [Patescibacteria group bacterium]
MKQSKMERKEILTNKKNKTLDETLVDGNHLAISGINQLLSK